MNLNATFFVELFIFGMFYYFVKVRIWPRFAGVIEERQAHIERGLAAAKDGHSLLNDAHKKAETVLKEAHSNAKKIMQTANQEALYLKDKVYLEMDEFKLSMQKEVLAECDQMKAAFLDEAKAHYLAIAKNLCEKMFEKNAGFCQEALESVLVSQTDQKISSLQNRV